MSEYEELRYEYNQYTFGWDYQNGTPPTFEDYHWDAYNGA